MLGLPVGDKALYLKNFLTHASQIGSIAPSSTHLIRKMLAPIDFSAGRTFVELGAGTGVITKALLKRMHPRQRLLCFEINPEMYAKLETIADARLISVRGTVDHLTRQIKGHRLPRPVYVLSGLPLANFPLPQTTKILTEIRRTLDPGGRFIQFQYSLLSRKALARHFRDIQVDYTPFNIPPAFVYTCARPKSKPRSE